MEKQKVSDVIPNLTFFSVNQASNESAAAHELPTEYVGHCAKLTKASRNEEFRH